MPNNQRKNPAFRLERFSSLLVWTLLSCSEDAARIITPTGPSVSSGSVVAAGADAGAAGGGEPLYALSYVVWSDDGPTGYVALSHTLEPSPESLANAREFPGYISMQAVDGQLLVAHAEEPSISRFSLLDDLSWELTDTLSFGNFGLSGDAAGFYQQYGLDAHTAYASFDVTQRVVWDPTDFVIREAKETSALSLERAGLPLYANFNRSYFVSGTSVLRPFSYHDDGWFTWASDTSIASYDAQTHEESAIIDAPCPALDTLSRDEAGNTYASTWEYSTLHALTGSGAAPCVVRLKPDNTLDESWNTDLSMWTQGRLVKNFRYIGGGKAVAAVLHDEAYAEDFDFGRYLESTDDFWANEGNYHRFWLFDVQAQSAREVSGVAFDYVSPAFFDARLDGRYFLLANSGDTNRSSGSIVHELGMDGNATPLFAVPGDALQWIRVR
jgi:hypothetical protein